MGCTGYFRRFYAVRNRNRDRKQLKTTDNTDFVALIFVKCVPK